MKASFLVLALSLSAFAAEPQTPPAAGTEKSVPTAAAPADVAAEVGPVETPKSWYEKFTPYGFLKVGYFFMMPMADPEELIGSRNGFRMFNVRVGGILKPVDKVEVNIGIEGAAPPPGIVLDPITGSRIVALRDAFAQWSASKYSLLRVGQFKPPYNAEALLPDGNTTFITRSILTEGLLPPDGFTTDNLSLPRQLGAQIASDRLGDDFGFRYALALTNGNGQNQFFNDNQSVAPVGRVVFEYKNLVALGANSYYNTLHEGARPNRITTNRVGLGADLTVKLHGFEAMGLYLQKRNNIPGIAAPADIGSGFMGQLYYGHTSGFEGGVRFAMLDPSDVTPDDDLWDLTAMVGYRMKAIPARLLLQYTYREENPTGALKNNSLDLALFVNW